MFRCSTCDLVFRGRFKHLAGGGEPGFDAEKFFKLRVEQYRSYRAAGERAMDALRGSEVSCGLPFLRHLVSCSVFRGFLQERTSLQVRARSVAY